MKRFQWKIVLCVLPVLVSAAVVAYALVNQTFKLGVDLAGGTDLIYQVNQASLDKSKDVDIQALAATIKRRIDPVDLYNVTVRPIGNTRVEIILPTGGTLQAKNEQAEWDKLLQDTFEHWPIKEYRVAVGRKTELLADVNAQYPDLSVQEIEQFIAEHYKPKAGADADNTEAWQKLLTAVSKQWPPKGYDVSRGRLQELVTRVREQYPDVPANEVSEFVDQHFAVNKERRQFTSEEVEHIKELVSQVGNLEFKILANTEDDLPAIEAARKLFTDVNKNEALKKQLSDLALAGNPPPAPFTVLPDKSIDYSFEVKNNPGVRHTYTWVELGKTERHQLRLDNKSEEDSRGDTFWKKVAEARAGQETIPLKMQYGTVILFSRRVENPRLPPDEAKKKYEYFVLVRNPAKGEEVTGNFLDDARPEQGRNLGLVVGFRFNSEGARRFLELTTKNKPQGTSENSLRRYLAVILDDKIESAPMIKDAIGADGVIEGDYKREEVDRLVRVLKSGALQASLDRQPVSESTMGATLGEYTVQAGFKAVLIAFAAILVFMLFYYRFSGLVACVALLANLLLTVAFMVLVNATFTLPGLAGLVLMLGMAVDANVLIYERLREERDRGASLALAIRNGYDRAFPTIIDTHLSSIFTAIVLYAVGNDQLKGFGISLTAGLVISLFTSLYMTRLMFDIWLFKGWLQKLSMASFKHWPGLRLVFGHDIDFMGIRYYWFTATIVLTILGAGVFFYRGINGLSIDFTGGTAYGGKLTQMVDDETLRGLFSTGGLRSDQRAELTGAPLADADLKQAVEQLPDLSVEQFFLDDPTVSQGRKSKLFNVRTSNKSQDEVRSAVSVLLGKLLARTDLAKYELEGTGPQSKGATLTFTNPDTGALDYASRSQVSRLLAIEFHNEGLDNESRTLLLQGLGREKEGRFQWMELQLLQPIDREKLTGVLKATQEEFARRPQPERLDNFDSQLATDTQKRALYAILASWTAILLYLWFRFGNWTFGLAAVLCLIHDLFFTLGVIGFSHYLVEWMPGVAHALLIQDFKIDLASVAALLTLVGYSVNDTIVVFDRIREVRGKNPLLTPQTINDSVNQTLSRTLLTALSVWLVVIVLYIFGGEGIHLFAFVMVAGVIVGTYSSIYIASPLLLIFGEGMPRTAAERQRLEAAQAEASAS
jgi:SecD/SecF fusion protein